MYIIHRADGGVSIMHMVAASHEELEAEIQKFVDVADKEWLPLVSVTQCKVEDLPADRAWRDAWTVVDGRVTISMPAAREIHRARLRTARAPMLQDLDVQYMRALEVMDGKLATEIADKKQVLRDITSDPRIDSAETVEQLEAVTLP